MTTERKHFQKGELVEYFPVATYFGDMSDKRHFAIVLKTRDLLQTADIYTMDEGQVYKNINYTWLTKLDN